MAELKRVFSKAIMNKDMDERLVPNGQYREAHNIEIATSEASEVGTVQTLFGNTERNQVIQNHPSLNNTPTYPSTTYATMGGNTYNFMGPHNKASVVGSVVNANTDKIYYLVSGGDVSDAGWQQGGQSNQGNDSIPEYTYNAAKDYIIEYDTVSNVHRYVFVDIFGIYSQVKIDNPSSDSTEFHVVAQQGQPNVPPGYRIGMTLTNVGSGQDSYDLPFECLITNVEYDADAIFDGLTGYWKITVNKPHLLQGDYAIKFSSERVLNFSKQRLITGINILDDFLFWTDNYTEPKKINITRSMAGTGGTVELNAEVNDIFYGDTDYFHTRLVKDKPRVINPEVDIFKYDVVTNAVESHPVYVTEEHVTVIRKAPTQPLELEMYRTGSKRVTSEGIENPTYGVINDVAWQDGEGNLLESGDIIGPIYFDNPIDIRVNDIILISSEDVSVSPNTFQDHVIRATVISGGVTEGQQDDIDNGPFQLEILSISPVVQTLEQNEQEALGPWYVKLEEKRPMFENRFPRFSYRYKYQDGEYSTFAPWSQIAFLPDRYEYFPKKGYNLGMVNQLRGLKLRYYHHDEDIIPQDVIEIDILYKETGKPNVYTVKTIKREGGETANNFLWPSLAVNPSNRGVFEIESDLIHAVVPSNQILRPWDNVPRKALAQEISANRLIYGNYLQNYHIVDKPIIQVGYEQTKLSDSYYFPQQGYAYPSVKTMRKYQVGVVFSDRYGRETPVLTHEKATVTVPKIASATRNRLRVNLDKKLLTFPRWAEYMSWYVKETSVEYYTMAMDRWYNAADGNIWISFPSSDRNKLDDETFIVLKKAHGTDEAVQEKARYRILAIENEAPDFIKTEEKSLGKIFNGVQNVIGPDGNGYPFQDVSYILIDDTPGSEAFSSVFGDLWVTTPDTIKLKFYGANQESKQYEISRVIKQGNTVRLNLTTTIDEDAAFVSTNDTFEGAINDLSMEIIEHEVENKPEFDGKFFVKIYKDEILEQFVLMPTEQSYQVVDSQEIGYLNNNGFAGVNTVTGVINQDTYMLAQQAGEGYEDTDSDLNGLAIGGTNATTSGAAYNITGNGGAGLRNCVGTSWHPTEHFHHMAPVANGGLGLTAYTWGQGDSGVADYNSDTIYPPCIFGTSELSANKVQNNPIIALNDGAPGVLFNGVQSANSTERFWKDVCDNRTFFIDACTAYTYCEGNELVHPIPGTNNSTGQDNFDEVVSFGIGSAAEEGEWFAYQDNVLNPHVGPLPVDYPEGFEGMGGGGARAASCKDGKGQPSRGIWGDDEDISYMDISWSGMGPGSNHPHIWGDGDQANFYGDNGVSGETGSWAADNNSGFVYHKLGDVTVIAGGGDMNGMSEDDAQATNAEYQSANTFITQLSTPGTMFRFNRDPDDVVYTVLGGGFPTSGGNDQGYQDYTVFNPGTASYAEGIYGIRNYRPDAGMFQAPGTNPWSSGWADANPNTNALNLYRPPNMRQRWTIKVTPKIGSGLHGYNPITGTKAYDLIGGAITPSLGFEDDPINADHVNHRRALRHDLTPPYDQIQILSPYTDTSDAGTFTDKPGIWETEPKESVELDIYYQASGLHPLTLNNSTNEEYLPIRQGNDLETLGGTKFRIVTLDDGVQVFTVTGFNDQTITFEPALTTDTALFSHGDQIKFTKRGCYSITGHINMPDGDPQVGDTTMTLYGGGVNVGPPTTHLSTQTHWLDWSNCWCFGNGVESDRIRDDFNAAQMDNGVKASTVLAEQVTEERRKHGLIWSGIYNSLTGVNNTNQFIQAEKITKDINPVYGSIQNILNRDTRLLMFCEDKILRAVTNKDALYNADGNPQLVASNAVIGDVTPYLGDYGIATNPESLVATASNVYFSDVVRGKVLALGNQGDGIRVISDNGMKDYFGDLFSENVWRSIGSYDERKKEYNLSVYKKYAPNYINPYDRKTISYNELSKGWISFKSFYPQQGVSLNNSYYTFDNGSLFEHHINNNRNNFYNVQGVVNGIVDNTTTVSLNESNISIEVGMVVSGTGVSGYPTVTAVDNAVITLSSVQTIADDTVLSFNPVSDITVLFNDQPNVVKSFMTLNYEGSQAKIPGFRTADAHEFGTTVDNWLSGDYSTNSGIEAGVTVTDGQYFNLADKTGWYAASLTTNLQECTNTYFKNKEDKYFGYITGETTDYTNASCGVSTLSNNLDEREFSVQGLGLANITHDDPTYANKICLTIANNTTASYVGDDSSGDAWDTAADLAEDALRWTCSSATISVPAGGTIAGSPAEFVNLTISPEDSDGNPTGALLSAANFSLGAATVSGGNTYFNVTGEANADPDDDRHQGVVAFTDNGTPGQDGNTINVYIQFTPTETYPLSDDTWYVDIDELVPVPTVDDPPDVQTRPVCFRTIWDNLPMPIAYPATVYDVTTDSSLEGQPNVVYGDCNITETLLQTGDIATIPLLNDNGVGNGLFDYDLGNDADTGGIFGSDNITVYKHEGTVLDGQQNLVAEIDFNTHPIYVPVPSIPGPSINSYYYYATPDESVGVVDSFLNMGDYAPYYNVEIIYGPPTDTDYWYTNDFGETGLIHFKVKIYYTPPPIDVLPDADDMCAVNPGPHTIFIRHAVEGFLQWLPDQGSDGNSLPEITNVSYESNISYDSRSLPVRILGREGAEGNLFVTRCTSVTDSSPAQYYNFETGEFQDAPAHREFSIRSNGYYVRSVTIPAASSKTNYCIHVQPRVSSRTGAATVLSSKVPTSFGEAIVTQHNIKTVTITPTTDTASNFGTLPTLTLKGPSRYPGKKRSPRIGGSRSLLVKCGNNSKLSTKLTIEKNGASIRRGMIVTLPYKGNTIPHNTTVVNVDQNIVTLSNAVSLATGSKLKFSTKNGRLVPFSLTIPAGAGKTLSLKDATTVNHEDAVSLGRETVKTVDGNVTGSATINLNNTRGIKANMVINGVGISSDADPDQDHVGVKTVASATQIIAQLTQTIADGTRLSFTYPEDNAALESFELYSGANDGINLEQIQASLDDNKLKIEGYLDISHISKDGSTIDIHIDDFVNVR